MRFEGTITVWKDNEGYGFITPASGDEDVFAHISSFSNRGRRPQQEDVVTYQLGVDRKGRRQAQRISFAGESPTHHAVSSRRDSSLLVSSAFFVALATAVFFERLPVFLIGLYLIASLLAFLVYALDKSAAIEGKWRFPESTLHFLALIGGWPGALIAQQQLRHKSRKLSFRIVFWVTVLLNCGVLALVVFPSALAVLQEWLAALPVSP